jgi:hypothetical protein
MQDRASSPVLTMGDNQESLFDDRLNRLNALIDQMNEKLELHPGRYVVCSGQLTKFLYMYAD